MLHIGDHQINDIFGAHALGIKVLWFNNTKAQWEQDFEKPDQFYDWQTLAKIIEENMSQDELSKAIINILKKEMGAIKDILPSDLLLNLQKVIGPELEKLIEKSGYVSKSKYTALEKLADNLEKRIIDLENKTKE